LESQLEEKTEQFANAFCEMKTKLVEQLENGNHNHLQRVRRMVPLQVDLCDQMDLFEKRFGKLEHVAFAER
jgi:hypothetical protein